MWSVWLSRNQQNNFKARIWIICQVKIREIVEWTGYGLLDKITWKKQINLALKNILCLWNVLSMNCPGNFFYEMFYLWNVLSMTTLGVFKMRIAWYCPGGWGRLGHRTLNIYLGLDEDESILYLHMLDEDKGIIYI